MWRERHQGRFRALTSFPDPHIHTAATHDNNLAGLDNSDKASNTALIEPNVKEPIWISSESPQPTVCLYIREQYLTFIPSFLQTP